MWSQHICSAWQRCFLHDRMIDIYQCLLLLYKWSWYLLLPPYLSLILWHLQFSHTLQLLPLLSPFKGTSAHTHTHTHTYLQEDLHFQSLSLSSYTHTHTYSHIIFLLTQSKPRVSKRWFAMLQLEDFHDSPEAAKIIISSKTCCCKITLHCILYALWQMLLSHLLVGVMFQKTHLERICWLHFHGKLLSILIKVLRLYTVELRHSYVDVGC